MLVTYSLTLMLTYVRHYSTIGSMDSICEDCVIIWRAGKHLKLLWEQPSWWLSMLFVTYCVINPVLQFAITFTRLVYLDEKGGEHFFLIGILTLPYSITALVAIWFYTIMLVVFYVFRILNKEIRSIVQAAVSLETETQFKIQKRFCELSDSLDAIAKVHLQVSLVAQQITNVLLANLVMWIVFKGSALLVTTFTCYMYCIAWMFAEDFGVPIQVFALGVSIVGLMWLELLMFIHICWMAMEEVNATCSPLPFKVYYCIS